MPGGFQKRGRKNWAGAAGAGGAGAIADEAQDGGDENAQNAGNVNFLMQHCYGQLEEEKPNKKKRRNSGTARPSSAAILDAIRREEVADHLGVAVQNPMLGAAELAAAAQRTANFSDFEWNKNHIVDYLYELTPRGSAQNDLPLHPTTTPHPFTIHFPQVNVIVLEDVDTVLPAPLPATVPIVTAASTLPGGVTMVTMMGMFLPHAQPPHIAPDVVPGADDVDHVGA